MSMRENTFRWAVISLILVIICTGAFADKTIYVDDDATGANDGSSWPDAYQYLQDALADANSADKPREIRVAQGIYRPDRSASEPNGTGDRTATFQLINGVTLKGGYAGLGQADPNARDIEACETILSGDLDSNDIDVNDPRDLLREPRRAENSYQVVTGSSTDETAVLDGFVITGGNADGPLLGEYPRQFRLRRGGGMYNLEGSPTLTNCTFSGNSAQNSGGGMVNEESNPTLTNCTFSDNSAGYYGGGMFDAKSDPTLTNCTFSDNSAGYSSGGMCNTSSNPTLTNCTFSNNNSAPHEGGGMGNSSSNPTLANCTFSGNGGGGINNDTSSPILNNCIFSGNYYGSGIENSKSNPILSNCMFIGNSAMYGGGMANASNSSPILTNCMFIGNSAMYGGGMANEKSSATLTNCTFAQNSAENGNALACDYYEDNYPSNFELINCILWDGGDEIWNEDNSTIVITFSNIQGDFPGEGNIDTDPLFADLGYWDPNGTPADVNDDYWVDGDYHLKSQAGRYDPNSQSWIHDDITSPCVDAGNPMSPIGNEPFPNGGIVNMGAYGGTAEASKSYFGEPICEMIVAGDINGDCKVDFSDFAIMALHWLEDNNP